MVYMSGDSAAEGGMIWDVERELALVGSTEEVQVFVLADRVPGGDHSRGDWTSTKFFKVGEAERTCRKQLACRTLMDTMRPSSPSYTRAHRDRLLPRPTPSRSRCSPRRYTGAWS